MSTVYLDPRHARMLVKIFEGIPSINKAAIFGSRALGTHKEGSDIDIVLYGSVNEKILGQIRNAIDDTALPYFVDVIPYDSIDNPALVQHIDDHARVIFAR